MNEFILIFSGLMLSSCITSMMHKRSRISSSLKSDGDSSYSDAWNDGFRSCAEMILAKTVKSDAKVASINDLHDWVVVSDRDMNVSDRVSNMIDNNLKIPELKDTNK